MILRRFNSRFAPGFTLIEMLIIITLIGILVTIAVPSYQRSLLKAREAVLKEDLYQIRKAIDAYFADHAKYPDSLEELVDNKYLREIPVDPITQSRETWETVQPEAPPDGELAEGGIFDIHSGSELIGLNGEPYAEW